MICLVWIGLSSPILTAQQVSPEPARSPRFFVDTDIGNRADLGFMLPASDFGISFEFPLWRRFELQGYATYSPDRKGITHDGTSINVGQQELLWVTHSFGLTAECDWHSLWTSQFTKRGWHPLAGVVFRDHLQAPGRLYVNLSIPTGCVWAKPGAPCPLQSNRLIGPTITQEWQLYPHLRFTLQGGFYHFCDQSNPNEPSIPRTCQWAGTEMLGVRFEFPGWKSTGKMY